MINHLKEAHLGAMRELGYTEAEIEKDWIQFCKEYEEYLDAIGEINNEYKPFGSSLVSVGKEEKWPW